MDPVDLTLGALAGGAMAAAFVFGRRNLAPSPGTETPAASESSTQRAEQAAEQAEAAAERVAQAAEQAAQAADQAAQAAEQAAQAAARSLAAAERAERAVDADPGGAPRPPTSPEDRKGAPEPARPRPGAQPEPELRLVAYACPQCGASVEVSAELIRCRYCEAAIRVEGRRGPRPTPTVKPGEPAPFLAPREATLSEYEFGRFELSLLRQAFHPDPREAMRWLPLGERHAGLFLLRVVREERGQRVPCGEPALLETLARAAEERLRERRDPGLALKAALQALAQSGAPGSLEAFAAVFDAELSRVTSCNAGCTSALIHCSVEEARPIDVTRTGQPLEPIALRGTQDPFSNHTPLELAADDAVVVLSAAFGGEGRGWPQGPGSTFRVLREGFLGQPAPALAARVHEAFWREREAGRAKEAPVGDLLIAAIRVRSNAELQASAGASGGEPLACETLRGETFALSFAPSVASRHELVELHSQRRALVLLEGLPSGAEGEALFARFRGPVIALLDGQTGDNDNARRAGRAGLAAIGAEASERAGFAAAVVFLHEVHGKVAFWTHRWPPLCQLQRRGERGGSLQIFDGGGETWLKPADRALLLGDLPLIGPAPARADQIPAAWPGGKASALYDLARQQEDHAEGAEFLAALARAVQTDAPGAPPEALRGVLVITRTGSLT